MLKMLVMLWHLLQMEVNLLDSVLELVLRTRPRDKNEHMQVRYQAVRNPQKRKRSSLSLRNEKSE